MKNLRTVSYMFFIFLFPFSLLAASGQIDKADSTWIIVATALVMFTTPAGLALFYGGMVRNKNLLNTYAMVFISYVIGSLVWMFWGYSLAFNGSIGGFIGGFGNLFL